MPTESSRRLFLKTATAVGAGLAWLPHRSYGRILGSNDRLNMAVIGTGGMGTVHTNGLVKRKEDDNIDVIQVCDVYRRRLKNSMNSFLYLRCRPISLILYTTVPNASDILCTISI